MQVTQVLDHITHANIGMKQKETIDFGISNDASFFHILSSTLYKDQRLAVVRETICNANDAHIEAGVTLPIEITLTNDLFTIRDFGGGIHKDDMGTIYGTYGNSTKKNDGNQTGGFGLGCKAPFAYTDHFDVHSFHDGIKTIYNLSKSSAAAQGKPGITPIVSVPTKETGLMVSIAVKNPTDRAEFERLIRKIVFNGDMDVLLNGEKLPVLGFTTETNYMMVPSSYDQRYEAQIMVRYGHVLYPVGHHADLVELAQSISRYLGKMRNTHHLFLQAKPHTIAVTPSREQLSMQDHTVAALKELMESFLSQINVGFSDYCDKFIEENVMAAVAKKDYPMLLNRNHGYASSVRPVSSTSVIRNPEQFAQRFMEGHYPDDAKSLKRDWKIRLIEMSKAGMLDRGKVMTFLRALDAYTGNFNSYWNDRTDNSKWLQKSIIGPLMAKLKNHGLDPHRLYVHDQEDARRGSYATYELPLIPVERASPKHLLNAAAYLRNIVVVTTNKRGAMQRAERHPLFKTMGSTQGILFYHLGSRQKDRDLGLEFFKASGMHVIDLTVRQDWEPAKVKLVATLKVVKAPGWAALSSIINDANVMDFRFSKEPNVARVTAPKFVLNVSMASGEYTNKTHYYDTRAMRTIVEFWGNEGVITNNDTLNEKLKGLGAVPLDDFIREQVLKYITTSPNMVKYWSLRRELLIGSTGVSSDLVDRVLASATLRKEFGIVHDLTPKDEKMLYLYQRVVGSVGSYDHLWPDDFKAAKALIKDIKPAPEGVAMVQKLAASPLLRLLNFTEFEQLISDKRTDKKVRDDAVSVFNLLLN